MSVKWLLWIGLYLVIAVLLPWATALSRAHQHGTEVRPRQLFQRRIRPGWPGDCDLVDLESPPISIHAANHGRSRERIQRVVRWILRSVSPVRSRVISRF